MIDKKIKEYSNYCLNCKVKPCSQKGCPLSNDIPAFIKCVKDEDLKQAYMILTKTTMLGSVCGRICPHEKQCQGSCVRGIKSEPVHIGEIEAYVFDNGLKNEYYKEIEKSNTLKDKKIAVIGSGPASLNASAFLAMAGADVTIYEKQNELGGILSHGIPEFRLNRDVLNSTINQILSLGIKIKRGITLGKDIDLEELKKNYDAVFLGIGANVPAKMNIPGEELEGVFGGNTLLEKGNHPDYTDKIVAVSGGGNVAMDCARTIKRLGAKKVYVIYRRAEEQMPAEKKEIVDAKNEGIEFLFQNNIVKIIGDEKVKRVECIKTVLVQKEGETRLSPVNIEGSNYELDVDYVVMAVGSKPDKNILSKLNLELNEWGYIKVDENYKTSDDKVYAGGDLIGQKATVAWAAKAGRDAAKAIERELKKIYI